MCFPENFAKFLGMSFLTEHLRWLLLLSVTALVIRNQKVIVDLRKAYFQLSHHVL